MRSPLQEFLWNRKADLLVKEKMAIGVAQYAISAQIQVIDAMFQFLATDQTEDDMAKLQLTLDKQATPVDDIKPRQDNQELTEGLIELAERLEKEWEDEVKRAKKEGRQPTDIKYPLNNLPDDIKPKSVSTKIYALRTDKKLPENILPAMRTRYYCPTCKEFLNGPYADDKKMIDVEDDKHIECKTKVDFKEFVYMKWVKNPPPVKTSDKGE